MIRRAACLVLAVAACLLVPAAAATGAPLKRGEHPPPSLFSLNTGTFDSQDQAGYERFVRDLPTTRRMGAPWIHLTGANIKFDKPGQPDEPNFAQMDSQVNRARRLGLGVLMSLGGIPKACSVKPRPNDVTTCPPTTAADRREYAKYLEVVLRRYKGKVTHYESWLEPNQASFWPPKANPVAYARLLRSQYPVFKRVDPKARLIFAGIGGVDLQYLRKTLDALKGRRVFHLVGSHPYRFPPTPPDVLQQDHDRNGTPRNFDWVGELTAYEQEFTRHGYGRPRMWLTEFGWPGNNKLTNPGDPYFPDEQAQADNLARAYRLMLTDSRLNFIQSAFWFNLRDYEQGVPNPDPAFFGYYGLLHNDFSAKPSGQYFEYFAKGGR